jgi:response regulator NasT
MNGKLRIAVAEDERDTREFLGELLTRLGHQPMTVANGRQLVDLCGVSQPDLIITDIKMPDMDGIEAAEAVNARRQTPVILVSAYHDEGLLARAQASAEATPVMAYLIKPVSEPDVRAALPVAMARFAQYREARQEAAELKQALEDRKVIERAKGAIMKRMGVSEEEAFARLRKYASDSNQRLVEAARKTVAAEEIFHGLEAVRR